MHFEEKIEKYEEYLAKEIVEKNFNFGKFNVNNEKPDLQNSIDNIGIEVTQATFKNNEEMKFRVGHIDVKSRNKDGSVKEFYTKDERNKKIEKFKKDYNKNNKTICNFVEIDNSISLIGIHSTQEAWRKVFEPLIIKAFEAKIEKLQTYKKFNNNGVFIFTEMFLKEEHLKHFYDVFKQLSENFKKEKKLIYDFIILNSQSNGTILYIDIKYFNNSKYIETKK